MAVLHQRYAGCDMSLQARVLIEFAPSETEAAEIRVEQIETIMPANADPEDASDLIALGDVTVSRMVEDTLTKTREQLVQMGSLLAEMVS